MLSYRVLGGSMSTTGMLQRATSEGDAAIQIYTDFFGPLEYDHLALTQSACSIGQRWPMQVYLPICYFWDSTIQHQLRVLDSDPTYWKGRDRARGGTAMVGPDCWLGNYRDQWMSAN
jgi:hypothetical protein